MAYTLLLLLLMIKDCGRRKSGRDWTEMLRSNGNASKPQQHCFYMGWDTFYLHYITHRCGWVSPPPFRAWNRPQPTRYCARSPMHQGCRWRHFQMLHYLTNVLLLAATECSCVVCFKRLYVITDTLTSKPDGQPRNCGSIPGRATDFTLLTYLAWHWSTAFKIYTTKAEKHDFLLKFLLTVTHNLKFLEQIAQIRVNSMYEFCSYLTGNSFRSETNWSTFREAAALHCQNHTKH
jgi:hypothetical protein